MIVIADQNWGLLVSLIAIIISSAITIRNRRRGASTPPDAKATGDQTPTNMEGTTQPFGSVRVNDEGDRRTPSANAKYTLQQ